MILSLTHKFIFFHVSKTAGTSIRTALEPFGYDGARHPVNRTLSLVGIHVNHYGPLPWRRFRVHTTAQTARAHLPAAVWEESLKIAFVRNPWDWMVSLYHYLQQQPTHKYHRKIKAMTFPQYLQWELRRNQRSQLGFIADRQGKVIVDYVGRFENLPDDFNYLCRRLNLNIELPRKNVSQHRDYREYYDDETRAIVASHYHDDITRFGYDFDNSTVQPALLFDAQGNSKPVDTRAAAPVT